MTYPKEDKYKNLRTPYAVRCVGGHEFDYPPCGLVYLTEEQYDAQMSRPNKLWYCPQCMGVAYWDDENYEQMLTTEEK